MSDPRSSVERAREWIAKIPHGSNRDPVSIGALSGLSPWALTIDEAVASLAALLDEVRAEATVQGMRTTAESIMGHLNSIYTDSDGDSWEGVSPKYVQGWRGSLNELRTHLALLVPPALLPMEDK